MAFKAKDLQPAAIAAGAIVVGGLLFMAHKKRKKCRELPGIWSEEGPLHLTPEAQEEAEEIARQKIKAYIMASDEPPVTLNDIVMSVADELRDCAWEDLETEHQKQVWHGIKSIVEHVNEEARQDRSAFLRSFS